MNYQEQAQFAPLLLKTDFRASPEDVRKMAEKQQILAQKAEKL